MSFGDLADRPDRFDSLPRATRAILIICKGRSTLATPIGHGWFKCHRCGEVVRGVEP